MCDDKKPTFDETAFVEAIKAATAFLQGRMALGHWYFNTPTVGKLTNDQDMFTFSYNRHYLTGSLEYARLESASWEPVSDEYLAHGLVHELAHAVLVPIANEINDNLQGGFLERVHNAEETVTEHITNIIWGSLTRADKDYLMGLFAKARTDSQPETIQARLRRVKGGY